MRSTWPPENLNSGSGTAGARFWPPVVFRALEAVKEGGKGRSTVVERPQYITRQKFFWIFCNLSLTFSLAAIKIRLHKVNDRV